MKARVSSMLVGLGNPGSAYDNTRHNVGRMIVHGMAASQNWTFRRSVRLKAKRATGTLHDVNVYSVLPQTFMNNSGMAVAKCMNYYKIAADDVLVVTDDTTIPFGTFRLREKGSSGGHNGLKSVEAYLGTQEYPRLRIGVGSAHMNELSEFVLSNFNLSETALLDVILKESLAIMDFWIRGDVARAIEYAANIKVINSAG